MILYVAVVQVSASGTVSYKLSIIIIEVIHIYVHLFTDVQHVDCVGNEVLLIAILPNVTIGFSAEVVIFTTTKIVGVVISKRVSNEISDVQSISLLNAGFSAFLLVTVILLLTYHTVVYACKNGADHNVLIFGEKPRSIIIFVIKESSNGYGGKNILFFLESRVCLCYQAPR